MCIECCQSDNSLHCYSLSYYGHLCTTFSPCCLHEAWSTSLNRLLLFHYVVDSHVFGIVFSTHLHEPDDLMFLLLFLVLFVFSFFLSFFSLGFCLKPANKTLLDSCQMIHTNWSRATHFELLTKFCNVNDLMGTKETNYN